MVRGGFDAGPLSWVKKEIDSAMQRAADALAACGTAPPDERAGRLKTAQTQLHQACGALQIVGLAGVTQVAQELEALLAHLERDSGAWREPSLEAAQRGFRGIRAYLDELGAGKAHQPLRLLDVYGALAEARGGAADPVDLYFPDLSHAPALSGDVDQAASPGEAREQVRAQRARYQRGLLSFLRNERSGAEEMRSAVAAIGRHSSAAQQPFWWVALGFFDALVADALPQERPVEQAARRLCNRVEQQLRLLAEGNEDVNEHFMREALYYVARSSPASERLREVQETYRLAETLPAAPLAAQSETDGVRARVREHQVLAKQAWERFAGGEAHALAAFRDQARALAEQGAELAPLGAVLERIAAVGEWLAEDASRMSEAIAIEEATALLFAASALEAFGREDFGEQAQHVCERLTECMEGRLLRTALDIPLLDEISRQAQEARIAQQTLGELRAQLRSVEQVLDRFFRDPRKGAELARIAEPLQQMDRSLELLGEPRAREALAGCAGKIRRFSASDFVPNEPEFTRDCEQLAQALSGLGFYIEALKSGSADFDEAMQPAAAAPARPVEPADVPPAAPTQAAVPSAEALVDRELLDVYLEEAGEVLEGVRAGLERLRADPSDAELLTAVRRGFHTLKGSGRMVGLKRLGEAAWAVEQALNLWLQQGRPAEAPLLQFIGEAHEYFSDAVKCMHSGASVADETPLVLRSEALRRGESPAAAPHASPGKAAAPAAPLAQAPVAEEEATLEIGAQQVSTTVFTLFSGEARMRITELKEEQETLKAHGIISDAMMRSVHTLAGIAGTVRIGSLHALAAALEQALSSLALAPLSSDEEALVQQAIESLEQMVMQAIELSMPESVPELVQRLEQIAPPALAVPVALPGEEEALHQSASEPAPEGSQALDPALIGAFLEEAGELVPAIERLLGEWQARPGASEPAQSLKRLLHTLKGSARTAHARALGELAHEFETCLEQALALSDANSVGALEPYAGRLKAQLREVQRAAGREVPQVPGETAAEGAATLRVRAQLVDRLVDQAGEVAIARSRIEAQVALLRATVAELTDNVTRLRAELRDMEIQAESQMASRREEVQASGRGFDALELDRFTRSQELARMMAESVDDVHTVQQNLSRAMESVDAALAEQARLNRDLQQDLMRVRMLPFESLAERLHATVREAARDAGKAARLELHGEQVGLDRSVLERMTAPLEHLIRNAIAHGIESAAERARAGKPPEGEIRLEVAQEGNEVIVLLADDGAGLDLERVRARARALGLPGADSPHDAEVAELIFVPGLSTAQQVSESAGRGIGMDVVKNAVASLGGRIALTSEPGRGTHFTIYLPLTLAVTRAVIVKAGAATYAVPTVMVEHVRQLRDAESPAGDAAHLEWQSRSYPYHPLAALLGLESCSEGEASPVLFVRSGAQAVAVRVDRILASSQEIVVKAIGPHIAGLPGITGATVLGSGEIVLILDPAQLALRRLRAQAPARAVPEVPPAAALVMVVDDSLTVRKITTRILEREGYRVAVARDGIEALEALQGELPAVMLVDIEMPRMDGFELTRRTRADPRCAAVPIIVITSRAAEKHEQHARGLGANHYLGKPFQEDELLRRVACFAARPGVGVTQ